GRAHSGRAPCAVLFSDNPYATYARAAQLLHPDPALLAGVHDSACVEPSARIAADAHIGPQAVVGADSAIGEGVVIGPGACIGQGVKIGAATRVGPRAVIGDGCCIGARGRIQPGAVIGGEGFGYARDQDGWVRIPHIGVVIIGDDVEIGANTTIDRGTQGDTVIGDGVILDNQIQIAHNVRIGDRTAMAGCVGVAGSAVIGRDCTIGGAANILGHLEIADEVHITSMSDVRKSITLAGTYSSGTPLDAHAEWRRNAARFRQLDALARRVVELEKNKF
ncbi:MAG: UDP-3-O-(3-hydroxymyristoyl)glucosamine N-acyltransferase, partial [Halofilum sp. (in: g-proteobacteria)]